MSEPQSFDERIIEIMFDEVSHAEDVLAAIRAAGFEVVPREGMSFSDAWAIVQAAAGDVSGDGQLAYPESGSLAFRRGLAARIVEAARR